MVVSPGRGSTLTVHVDRHGSPTDAQPIRPPDREVVSDGRSACLADFNRDPNDVVERKPGQEIRFEADAREPAVDLVQDPEPRQQ